MTHYAYGQHDDGEVGIWVAGQAGWYSITPARGYRPVFNEMVEAIDLLYFLADRHQRRRGKRKNWNPTVEYLCDEVGALFCPVTFPRCVEFSADLGFFLSSGSMSITHMESVKMETTLRKCSISIIAFSSARCSIRKKGSIGRRRISSSIFVRNSP